MFPGKDEKRCVFVSKTADDCVPFRPWVCSVHYFFFLFFFTIRAIRAILDPTCRPCDIRVDTRTCSQRDTISSQIIFFSFNLTKLREISSDDNVQLNCAWISAEAIYRIRLHAHSELKWIKIYSVHTSDKWTFYCTYLYTICDLQAFPRDVARFSLKNNVFDIVSLLKRAGLYHWYKISSIAINSYNIFFVFTNIFWIVYAKVYYEK